MDVMRDLGHKWLLRSEFLGVTAMHWTPLPLRAPAVPRDELPGPLAY